MMKSNGAVNKLGCTFKEMFAIAVSISLDISTFNMRYILILEALECFHIQYALYFNFTSLLLQNI